MHLTLETVLAGEPVIVSKAHPFAIVLSQDCDLDWDFKAQRGEAAPHKRVANLLFCEMQVLEEMKATLRNQGQGGGDLWRRIIRNDDARFHVLPEIERGQDRAETGIPPLGIDFKRFFTLPSDEVYVRLGAGEAQRRCFLDPIYAAQLSDRFAHFNARVASPDEYAAPGAGPAPAEPTPPAPPPG